MKSMSILCLFLILCFYMGLVNANQYTTYPFQISGDSLTNDANTYDSDFETFGYDRVETTGNSSIVKYYNFSVGNITNYRVKLKWASDCDTDKLTANISIYNYTSSKWVQGFYINMSGVAVGYTTIDNVTNISDSLRNGSIVTIKVNQTQEHCGLSIKYIYGISVNTTGFFYRFINNIGESIYPTCTVTNGVINNYYYEPSNMSSNNTLSCILDGYLKYSINYTLTNGSRTFEMNRSILNLTFSEATNITITSTGTGLTFVQNTSLFLNQSRLGEGEVLVNFGNNQVFSYNNDLQTSVVQYLYVTTPDLVQKIKVLESGTGVKDVIVKVYKQIAGTNQLIFSAYTDGNGQAVVNIDDANTYIITAEKSGYDIATKLIYIPAGNTETILINIESTTSSYGTTLFISNCKNKISRPTNCHFEATANQEIANITIIVNLNGTVTSKGCTSAETCLTDDYSISNSSYPINATLYFDGTKIEPIIKITYVNLEGRTVQINFPVTTIKSNTNYLILFYFMTLIMGLFIAVSIEKKTRGWGLLSFIVWMGIIAYTGFWEYWLVIIPLVIIQIAKLYYGWLK